MKKSYFSRREFLSMVSTTAAALVLTACGLESQIPGNPESNQISPNSTYNHAQISMTLAAFSYLEPSTLESALGNSALPTQNQWQLVWGPYTVEENLSYIVKGPDNIYAYVVRGTELKDVLNLLEDIRVHTLHDLPWNVAGFPATAQISRGAVNGWARLTQSGHDPWADYLSPNLPSGATLFVVGHSLGGMLASVMGAYFYCMAQATELDVSVRLYTFAGQTAGNQDFANAVDAHLDGKGRYYNNLDVVPKAFNHEELESIKEIYSCERTYYSEFICDTTISLLEKIGGTVYVQPPNGTQLTSAFYQEHENELREQMAAQHSSELYLYLLGVPLDVVRQVFERSSTWSPPPMSTSS